MNLNETTESIQDLNEITSVIMYYSISFTLKSELYIYINKEPKGQLNPSFDSLDLWIEFLNPI